MEELPIVPGSYALHLRIDEPARLTVGRLGTFCFPCGDYFYLGSAHGPGGLRARLRHHVWSTARPLWHLDWLRPHTVLLGGWFSTTAGALECAWSKALLALPGVVAPARGFGAADCRSGCVAHLVVFAPGVDCMPVGEQLRLSGDISEWEIYDGCPVFSHLCRATPMV